MATPQCFFLAFLLAFAASGRDAESPRGNPRFQEVASADGRWIAFVNAEDGDSEICIERADGTQRRQLTSNDSFDNNPSFSPDGRHIAFASNRSGAWQIHRMDADGGDVTQLTHQKAGCVKPRYGAKGQLAYLAHHGRAFKRELYDLVVREGDVVTLVQQKIPVWDFAWHPDGQLIACSTDGQLIVRDLRAGTTKVVPLTDVDPRLDSYGLFDLRWSAAEEGFVGRLNFLGGVPQGAEVFGDGELLLIPIAGRSRFVSSLDE